MQATNFALRPMIKEDSDTSEHWEILKIVNDDVNTVYTIRVGVVEVPNMGYTPLTFLQFILAAFQDQHPETVEQGKEQEASSVSNQQIEGEFVEI